MRDITRDEWRALFNCIACGKTRKAATSIVFVDGSVKDDDIGNILRRNQHLKEKYNKARELRSIFLLRTKKEKDALYSRRYRSTEKGKASYKKRLVAIRKTGPKFKYNKKRSNPEYRKWEASIRKARRAAHVLGVPSKEIMDAWGLESWRVYRWKLVDYSQHEIEP
jgi:hypothetical protein